MGTRTRLGTAILACAMMSLAAAHSRADARSDYLINMLENGATYRIRVQAATTLGAIRCAEASTALVNALADESDLVVIAAANALAQIGDPAAIPAIEKALQKPPSPPAQSQLEIALRILKALSQGDDYTPAPSTEPKFLIRVDAMGNSSTCTRTDLSDTMKTLVLERLSREPGVVIQSAGMSSSQVSAKVKKEKLTAFVLSGSIMRLERMEAQLTVKISLNVFSNPGYSLLAMPSAEGSVAAGVDALDPEAERAMEDRALKAVVDGLVSSVLRSLDEMSAQRSADKPPEGE